MNRYLSHLLVGAVCVGIGWSAGKITSGELTPVDALAMNWVNYTVSMVGADGRIRTREEAADVANGTFIALTRMIGNNYSALSSEDVREQLKLYADIVADNPHLVSNDGLALGGKDEALRVMGCIKTYGSISSREVESCARLSGSAAAGSVPEVAALPPID